MEAKTIKVPVGKVMSSTDRKHGGEGNIETLAQSIKEHGLIHPPAVKEVPDKEGCYRVIAGRRRIEAVKSLGWKNVEVTVYPAKSDDEAIALAENVNREDMHPLDEAETFKRQMDAGKPVEEIAKHYARSVSGIYHRVRLCDLIDGIKTMFRDGKINLSGAALIASLPESDQESFFKKYGSKSGSAGKWDIAEFIRKAQKLSIKYICDKECEQCKKRTFNTAPDLFEDYSGLEDVCFDPDCYMQKWQGLIHILIAEQSGDTENNIIIGRGIPPFYPNKAKSVIIGEKEYNILPGSSYRYSETKKKAKSKTAYLISLKWHMSSETDTLKVERVSYEKYDRSGYGSSGYQPPDPVKNYLIDQIPEIKEKDRKAVAEKLEKKYQYYGRFKGRIKEAILDVIIERRIKEEVKPEFAASYLTTKFSGEDDKGEWQPIDPDYRDIVTALFGPITSFSEIAFDPTSLKVFLFMATVSIRTGDMPDIDSEEYVWTAVEKSLFWHFAKISRDEYIQMYRERLSALVAEAVSGDTPSEETDDEDGDQGFDDECGEPGEED